MQPEEIIQQKEWQQLTAEEKKVLQPLLADEQEFNLLKKMLLVADEVSADVPTIGPAVQEQLTRSVKRSDHQRADRKIWYYAAATIALVAIAAWFYLHTGPDRKNEIVSIPPKANIDSQIVVNPSKIDETVIDTPKPVQRIIPKKSDPHTDLATTKNSNTDAPVQKDPDVFPGNPVNSNRNTTIAFVKTSTLIKDDTELLSLITEVY